MAITPKDWRDDPDTTTPLSAAALEDLETRMGAYADILAAAALPKAGGTMTGKITLDGDPTAALHAATRQYVLAQITALINGAPGTLDTLKELADLLTADDTALTALIAAVALKAPLASPAFTGTPLITTTPTPGDNSHKVADTAFVEARSAAAQDGFTFKEFAAWRRSTALPAHTRTGNVLTASANGSLTFDADYAAGGNMSSGWRLLVMGETGGTALENGIYDITDPGSPSVPWILTRAGDADGAGELVNGSRVTVLVDYWDSGIGSWSGGNYYITTADPIVINTTAITWQKLRARDDRISDAMVPLVSAADISTALSVLNALDPGDLKPTARASAPAGWLLCQGQSILRADYADLFAAIGTTFGSADGTHFTLPNFQDKFPVGKSGTKALGSTGGADSVTLTAAQSGLPEHAHVVINPAGNTTVFQAGTNRSGVAASAVSTTAGVTGGAAAAGSSHENKPPYLAINWLIKT